MKIGHVNGTVIPFPPKRAQREVERDADVAMLLHNVPADVLYGTLERMLRDPPASAELVGFIEPGTPMSRGIIDPAVLTEPAVEFGPAGCRICKGTGLVRVERGEFTRCPCAPFDTGLADAATPAADPVPQRRRGDTLNWWVTGPVFFLAGAALGLTLSAIWGGA